MPYIKLSVPSDSYSALTRACDMLHGLAQDLKHEGGPLEPKDEGGPSLPEFTEAITNIPLEMLTSATSAFGEETENPNLQLQAYVAGGESRTLEQINNEEGADVALVPTGATLDADGLPWDARIHSGAKTTVKAGQWKKKKNVPTETIAAVEAELREVMAIPAGAIEMAGSVPASDNIALNVEDTPAPAPATPTPVVRKNDVVVVDVTLPVLISRVTAAGKMVQLNEEIQKLGLTSVALLGARPDLIPQLITALDL